METKLKKLLLTTSILSLLLLSLTPSYAASTLIDMSLFLQSDASPIVGHTTGVARMREASDLTSNTVKSLQAGVPVAIIAEVSGETVTIDGLTSDIWYEVEEICGNGTGYIWSGLIESLENEEFIEETVYIDHCVTFNVAENVPDSYDDAIRLGVFLANRYAQELGVEPIGQVIYTIGYEGQFCGEAPYPEAIFNIGICPQDRLTVTGAHEFFHLIQNFLSPVQIGPPIPAWLIEGSVE
jgi:hypothetical protein